MEMSCGGCCSPGCTCILGRNLVGTLLSFIYPISQSSKASSSSKDTWQHHSSHHYPLKRKKKKKKKGCFFSFLLSGSKLLRGLMENASIQRRKKIVEIENPPIEPSFGSTFLKGELGTFALPEFWPQKPQNWLWFVISVL